MNELVTGFFDFWAKMGEMLSVLNFFGLGVILGGISLAVGIVLLLGLGQRILGRLRN